MISLCTCSPVHLRADNNGIGHMNAKAHTHKMFFTALTDMTKSVQAAKSSPSFSWEDVKPYLKSIGHKSKRAKVMSLAWKLYKNSPMTGATFDPIRFAFYVSCAHAEVKAENKPPVKMTREQILFIGSDCATEPKG